MRIWADVYDPTGVTKQGVGDIQPASVTVRRVLDGPGTVSITLPGTDSRAIDLLQPKSVVRVYVDGLKASDTAREVGAFVVDAIPEGDGSSRSLRASGSDLLSLLNNKLVGLGRAYSNQSVTTIVTALAALAGWTVDAETGLASDLTSVRYEAASTLKAIQKTLDYKGYHLRIDTGTNNQIQIGAFGDDNGLRVENVAHAPIDLYNNDDLLLIERLDIVTESNDLVNAILPLGAGSGDAALTLEKSTRGRMVTQTGGDGRNEYWLEDATSIATYGRIERRMDIKDIGPISNSASDVINAANALDDAAYAELQRRKNPRHAYGLTARKINATIQPGDQITLNYNGVVRDTLGNEVVRAVRGAFWVLSVTERWGVEGGAVDLEIADVDTYDAGVAGTVVGAIDAITVQGVAVQPYPAAFSYVYVRQMSSSFTAKVPIYISNAMLDVTRCTVRFSTRPFRSNVAGAASGGAAVAGSTSEGGGDHNHRVLAVTGISGFPGTTLRPYLGRNSDGGAFLYTKLESNSESDLWTEASSGAHSHSFSLSIPAHTHAMNYGIFDDSTYPQVISLAVNGTDRTVALGGTWAASNAAIEQSVEISDYLKAGTLQQKHELEFSCTAGQGEVEVIVEVYGIIQNIAVS